MSLCRELCRYMRAWNLGRHVLVLCGKGHNGADALALLPLLKGEGFLPCLVLCDPDRLNQESLQLLEEWVSSGGVATEIRSHQGFLEACADFPGKLVLDGLLGTGFNPPLKDLYRDIIQTLNSWHDKMVVAIDIPSGLSGDGVLCGVAVKADLTLALGSLKPVFMKAAFAPWFGRVEVLPIGFTEKELCSVSSHPRVFSMAELKAGLFKRPRHWHKGDSGRLLVIGGNEGMEGALYLSAYGAHRAGAGLISMVWLSEHQAFRQARPEWMQLEFASFQKESVRRAMLDSCDCVVLGMGLAQTARSFEVIQWLHEIRSPMVIDADALNILSHQFVEDNLLNNAILTPHVGEAARLLRVKNHEVVEDLTGAALTLAEKFNCTVILKSYHTVVCQEKRVKIHLRGTQAMASGGMGDILSGVAGAFLASGCDAFTAANLAVAVHGLGGEFCERDGGDRGIFACEVADHIPQVIRQCMVEGHAGHG